MTPDSARTSRQLSPLRISERNGRNLTVLGFSAISLNIDKVPEVGEEGEGEGVNLHILPPGKPLELWNVLFGQHSG